MNILHIYKQKLTILFITAGIVIFYSQIVLWQNYLAERTGKPPELNFMDAEYHLQRGMDFASEEEFQKAVRLDPANPKIYFMIADVYMSEGKRSEAYGYFRQSMLLSDKYEKDILNKVFESSGNLLELKKIVPEHPERMFVFAKVLYEKGLLDEALNEFQAVLEAGRFGGAADLHRQTAAAYAHIGGIYLQKEKFDLALDNYKKSIEADPGHASGLYGMALAYASLGRYKDAIEYYRRCLKLFPKNFSFIKYCAIALEKNGDASEALSMYKRALAVNPNDDFVNIAVKRLKESKI